ncbi:PIG-L family deacetylase [Krasilnikovia sp. MM14-A1259]|uniref:PIG-L family deacetylase n=1 Tax=Krasilnikovia sp. MM14-A1259 TaxID=3373539 RepID=UPI00380FA827
MRYRIAAASRRARSAAGALCAAVAVVALAAPTTAAPAAPPRGAATCPTTLSVVAHQDDDILFINPDLQGDIRSGRCIVAMFLTAGDAGRPTAYWRGREAGAMAAYATMAGRPNRWVSKPVTLAGHPVTRVTLVGRRISLLFLRLPDGHGYANHDWETIAQLWKGSIPAVHSIDSGVAYSRDGLVDTVGDAMRVWRPDVVRTLDYTVGYGPGDHGDHQSAAYVTYAAHQAYATAHRLYAYRGYRVSDQPENLSLAAARAKMGVFLAYAQHDATVCKTPRACRKRAYWGWFYRRYRTADPPSADALPPPPAVTTALPRAS